MKPEIKKQWIEALRSGKFEQGTGFLKWVETLLKDNKEKRVCYCCLGVLCVVLKDHYPSMAEHITIEPHGIRILEYDDGLEHDVGQEISGEICQLIDLPENEMSHLIKLNDEYKASFERIADYIEERL